MPYTRQRPDGTNETHSPTPIINHQTPITRAVPTSNRYIQRNKAAVSSLIIAAVAAVISLGFTQEAQARPVAKAKTTKLTGTWGYTSGSQTYLRARPSAKVPPVAKVPTHTPLYVWGKFDGWYRVETKDHVFGWVFNSYVNIPDASSIKELSHAKAKLASDRTGHQTMYGSKELLAGYYSRYGASGAAKGLVKHGVQVAKAPSKSNPRLAQTKAAQTKLAQAKAAQAKAAQSRIARSTPSRPVILAAVPDPAFNDVGNVHLSPSAPRTKRDDRWGGRTTSSSPQPAVQNLDDRIDTPSDTSPDSVSPATPDKAPAAAPKAAQPVADNSAVIAAAKKKKEREAKMAAEKARKAEAARLAAARLKAAKLAKWRLAQENARKAAAAKEARLAEARKAENWRAIARQKRLAEQREQIRKSMGTSAAATPPAGGDLAPLSPEELLKARNAFLATQKSDGSTPGAVIAPSAFNDSSVTAARGTKIPVITPAAQPAKPAVAPKVAVAARYAKPSSAKTTAKTAPSRGGSPRDYAAYAQKQQTAFGEGLANSALAYRGMPYIYGASNPRRGFDCSGLVNYVLRQRGYNPPRTAAGLASYGKPVGKSELKPGDILLFGNTYRRGISHVGIYMGNGKMIHAANPSRGVRVDNINSGYYAAKYAGARRIK